MSLKLVVIVGATGKQGGSAVDALLKSPTSYTVRAITRNINSTRAQSLVARGVEIVTGDLDSYDSLLKAFHGAYTVFGVTDFWTIFGEKQDADDAHKREYEQGKRLVDAAAATPTLQHFIWSTLASVDKSVPHFLSKARIDEYLATKPELARITTYLIVGYYSSNLAEYDPPRLEGGKYVWKQAAKPDSILPTAGYAQINCGLLVDAILQQPKLTKAKSVAGYVGNTLEETLQLWGKAVGEEVEYVYLPFDEYVEQSPLGPKVGLELAVGMAYFDSYGLDGFVKPGIEMVTKEQLGVEGWVDAEEAFRRIDWSSVLAK